MALTQSALATEFLALVPEAVVADAKTNFAQAYGNYLKAATANAVPTNGPWIDSTLVPALAGGLTYALPGTAAGAAADLVAGLVAGWAAAVAAPAAFITGATVIVPPTFAALTAALTASLAILEDDLTASANSLATDIHTATLLSPTAQFGVPVFPIL